MQLFGKLGCMYMTLTSAGSLSPKSLGTRLESQACLLSPSRVALFAGPANEAISQVAQFYVFFLS